MARKIKAKRARTSAPVVKAVNTNKWLYIGGAIIILLILLYIATNGQLFAGFGYAWTD